MTEVLQPLNERVAETVVKNADLLESHAMEPLLLQLIAHVSAYRVIIKRCGRLLPPYPPRLCANARSAAFLAPPRKPENPSCRASLMLSERRLGCAHPPSPNYPLSALLL